MKIFLTGGTGFIGANLTRRLVADGHEVHLLVRPEANFWRVADLRDQLSVHTVDLADAAAVRGLMESIRPSHVAHLATYGAYPAQTDVAQMVRTNVLGALALLGAARAVGVEMFVNTGSSSEYGIKQQPMREDDSLQPTSAYGATKAAATRHCQLAGQAGFPVVTLRPFSVYGSYEATTRLFPTALAHVLRGKEVALADPRVARDFTDIADVVEGYLAALQANHLRGEVINLASGRQTTLADFAAALLKVTDGRATVRWDTTAGRANDATTWVGDARRAKELLGWSAKTSLEDGLRNFRDWMNDHIDWYAKS